MIRRAVTNPVFWLGLALLAAGVTIIALYPSPPPPDLRIATLFSLDRMGEVVGFAICYLGAMMIVVSGIAYEPLGQEER